MYANVTAMVMRFLNRYAKCFFFGIFSKLCFWGETLPAVIYYESPEIEVGLFLPQS